MTYDISCFIVTHHIACYYENVYDKHHLDITIINTITLLVWQPSFKFYCHKQNYFFTMKNKLHVIFYYDKQMTLYYEKKMIILLWQASDSFAITSKCSFYYDKQNVRTLLLWQAKDHFTMKSNMASYYDKQMTFAMTNKWPIYYDKQYDCLWKANDPFTMTSNMAAYEKQMALLLWQAIWPLIMISKWPFYYGKQCGIWLWQT